MLRRKAIPEHLLVAAAGKFEPGLAIGMRFGLKSAKSLFFIVFMYCKPLVFTREQLLAAFNRIETLALAGGTSPRKAFNGEIEVEALTEAEIQAAISNYHRFADVWPFPVGYLPGLERALEINRKSNCIVNGSNYSLDTLGEMG